jgi:hypothetical protein
MKFVVVPLSLVWYLNKTTAVSFQIQSNSSFAYHPTLYTVYKKSVVKKTRKENKQIPESVNDNFLRNQLSELAQLVILLISIRELTNYNPLSGGDGYHAPPVP